MNCEIFQLKELEVEPHQIREVLRCVLHTIMFNRALGLVRPRDTDSVLFDINYVQCGDATFDKKLEDTIDKVLTWVDKHPKKKISVCLSFFETRSNKTAWFSNKTERLYWEQWYINLSIVNQGIGIRKKSKAMETDDAVSKDRLERPLLEADLQKVLFQVLQFVNEKRDHVPPVTSSDLIPFPYEITIPSSSDTSSRMDVFKRMLQTAPPTILS